MLDMPSSAEQPAKAIAAATAAGSRAIRKMFSVIEDLSAECGQAGVLGSAYLGTFSEPYCPSRPANRQLHKRPGYPPFARWTHICKSSCRKWQRLAALARRR